VFNPKGYLDENQIKMNMIKAERIYNVPKGKGFRILVDRLWPRGLSKNEVNVDLWNEFKERYFKELDLKKDLVDQVIARVEEGDTILLYGAKDEEHNNAVALKEYIEAKMKT
jgi:uncharacterized protein YeaO (DUF488 family)